jgi:hypothetical protein
VLPSGPQAKVAVCPQPSALYALPGNVVMLMESAGQLYSADIRSLTVPAFPTVHAGARAASSIIAARRTPNAERSSRPLGGRSAVATGPGAFTNADANRGRLRLTRPRSGGHRTSGFRRGALPFLAGAAGSSANAFVYRSGMATATCLVDVHDGRRRHSTPPGPPPRNAVAVEEVRRFSRGA